MNEQVNYAKIQRIQDDLEALTIGQFGTGFVTDAMLYESGIKGTVANHTSQLVEKAKHIYPTMTTAEIQSILDNYREVLFVDGTFNVNPLLIKSNTVIYMSPNTIIKSNTGYGTNDSLFLLDTVTNVTIYGNHAKLQMLKSEYTTGEWRHGVRILLSKNITIYNLHSVDSGGDGFYIGNKGENTGFCENITLFYCHADNNRRQGLSIASAKNVNIIGGTYSNTTGTAPSAGIDIEPNYATDYIENVNVWGVRTENNDGGGINIVPNYLQNNISVRINNWVSKNDGGNGSDSFKFANSPSAGKLQGEITVNNVDILNPQCSGIGFYRWNQNAPKVKLNNVKVTDVASNISLSDVTEFRRCGFVYKIESTDVGDWFGNIEINDLQVIDTRDTSKRTFIPLYINNGTSQLIKNIIINNLKTNVWTNTSLSPSIVNSNSENVIIRYTEDYKIEPQSSITLTKGNSGCTVVNSVTKTTLVATLPLANECIGMEFIFRTAIDGGYVSVKPNAVDKILRYGTDLGIGLIARQNGEYIKIKSLGNNSWQVIGISGQWASWVADAPYGSNRVFNGYVSAIPTSGTWAKGDILYNNNVSAGGYLGWVCVIAGTPGTWKGFGLIQA